MKRLLKPRSQRRTPPTARPGGATCPPGRIDELRATLAGGDLPAVVSFARHVLAEGAADPLASALINELTRRCEGLAVGANAVETVNTLDPADLARYRESIADVCDAAIADEADRVAEAWDVFPYPSLALREAARRIRTLDAARR